MGSTSSPAGTLRWPVAGAGDRTRGCFTSGGERGPGGGPRAAPGGVHHGTAALRGPLRLASGPVGPFTITANSNQLTQPVIERIKETLRMHPGKREVQLVVTEQGKTSTHKLSFQVTLSPSLNADLKAILGADCVR